MELTINGKLENVYQSKEYTNQKTGVVTPSKWSLQFMEELETEQGVQLVIHKVNVPDEKIKEYKDKVGDLISVPVKVWVMNGKIGFTGV
jgi:lysyl-tRNA synthetase class II